MGHAIGTYAGTGNGCSGGGDGTREGETWGRFEEDARVCVRAVDAQRVRITMVLVYGWFITSVGSAGVNLK